MDPLQVRVAIHVDDWLEPYRASGGGEIWIDLGCGKGELVAALAGACPAIFFIGIEVRRSVAERYFPQYRHIPNLLLLHGNVNLSIPSMMGQRKVQRVFIHFPDPCDHKPRHRKRQMVNGNLVEGIGEILAPEGVVSVKTDREEMLQEMDHLFQPRFQPVPEMAGRPGVEAVRSEWEKERIEKSIPIFSRSYRLRGGLVEAGQSAESGCHPRGPARA